MATNLSEAGMGPLYLFNVLSRHNQWLSIRQTTIAGNVANANTSGFKALDVEPFEVALESSRLSMTATNPAHITTIGASVPATEVRKEEAWETTQSGNTVSLEQELMKASEVDRAYKLNVSVAKAFHRMLMTSSKA